LIDFYRIFHPPAAEYTFFSAAHGTFSKVSHMLGHKASLNRCKKIKITFCILSDYNSAELEINKRKYRKYSSTWAQSNSPVSHYGSAKK
jgi:hypothetical protein